MAVVLKTTEPETVPGVRIPLPPPCLRRRKYAARSPRAQHPQIRESNAWRFSGPVNREHNRSLLAAIPRYNHDMKLGAGAGTQTFLSIVAFAAVSAATLAQPPYPITTGRAYKFETVAPGVYYASATGTMVTGSNNVVDRRRSRRAGRRHRHVARRGARVRSRTQSGHDKPVRYVVNTHFHYDHTDGNQVYAGQAPTSSRTST